MGTAADAAGLGLTLYAIGDYGLRWHDNYRAGGCADLWGARPEISPLDVALVLAGPTVKAGKWAFRSFGKAAPSLDKSWKQLIVGRGQATGTLGHRFRSYREAIALAKSGRYERVYLNRAYSTATGIRTTPRRLPDVLGVRKTGRVDAIEVPSKTDDPIELVRRNKAVMNQLPYDMQGDVLLRYIK